LVKYVLGAPRLHASIQFHDFRRAGNRDLGLAAISSASVAFRQRLVWIGLDEPGGNAQSPAP
jgi:hypothetical protein